MPNGGTGNTNFTAHGVIIGNGTGGIGSTLVGATGTILAGVTGADPAYTATPSVTSVQTSAGIGAGGAPSAAAWVKPAAATTAVAQFNLPTGGPPTSPNDGDIWREDNTNTGLKIRINGVTKTVTVT